MENGDPIQKVNYQISLYEDRKIERVRKRHQISGEVGKLERTKDGTKKMDMTKRPT